MKGMVLLIAGLMISASMTQSPVYRTVYGSSDCTGSMMYIQYANCVDISGFPGSYNYYCQSNVPQHGYYLDGACSTGLITATEPATCQNKGSISQQWICGSMPPVADPAVINQYGDNSCTDKYKIGTITIPSGPVVGYSYDKNGNLNMNFGVQSVNPSVAVGTCYTNPLGSYILVTKPIFSGGGGGLPKSALIGGPIGLALIIAGIVFWCYRRHKSKQAELVKQKQAAAQAAQSQQMVFMPPGVQMAPNGQMMNMNGQMMHMNGQMTNMNGQMTMPGMVVAGAATATVPAMVEGDKRKSTQKKNSSGRKTDNRKSDRSPRGVNRYAGSGGVEKGEPATESESY